MAVDHPQSTTRPDRQMALVGEYPAEAVSVRHAREAVATLARRWGASRRRVEDVRLAISEAATNVVLHAYEPGESGTFRVLAAAPDSHRLLVVVEDDGRGFSAPSQSPGLGAGLRVMQEVAEEASFLEGEAGGSTVQLSFALGSSRAYPRTRPLSGA